MDTQQSTTTTPRRHVPKRMAIAIAAIVIVVAGIAFAGIAQATDQPSFCGSACHEMGPFHSAWTEGAHMNVACVECHVDVGTVARMEHKVVALKEVAAHVTGDYTFPQAEVTPVPSERCIRCHTDVRLSSPGFSHADHAKRGECVTCHTRVGHDVSVAALKEAGVYNASTKASFDTSKTAAVDGGSANLAGHKTVPCSRCHNMAATPCADCHDAKHEDRGKNCAVCHTPGEKFVFTHPARSDCGSCHEPKNPKHTWKGTCTDCHKSGPGVDFKATHPTSTACSTCHKRPDKHRDGQCATCHKNTGTNWAFAHPSGACSGCHKRPANHKSGPCASCHHNPGKNWAYAHPTSGNCTACHSKPAKHKSGSCTNCHKSPGVNWAFTHPGKGSACTSCHAKPSGHRAGSCSSCHKSVGKSWRFTHPGKSSSCASCHARPGGHRSGSCVQCHTAVGKNWGFSHPGDGSNCSSCHGRPSGHRSGSCQSCHSRSSGWKFRHPSSSGCSSCHKAPGGHYGSSCSNCHSPSRSWRSATFSHPRIPGGEHSFKSFACTKCHPGDGRGPGHYCSCHGNTSGPEDD